MTKYPKGTKYEVVPGSRCITTKEGIKVGCSYAVTVFDRIKVPAKLLETVTRTTTSLTLDSLHLEPREIEVSTAIDMVSVVLRPNNGIFVPFVSPEDAGSLVKEGYGRYVPTIVEVICANAYIHLLAADKELQDATELFVNTPEDARCDLPLSIRELAEMCLAEENWLAGLQYPEDKPDRVVYRVRPPEPSLFDVCNSIVASKSNLHLSAKAESAVKTCNIFRIGK